MDGIGINKIRDKVKILNKYTEKIQKSLNSQNAWLKDLVNKIRSSDILIWFYIYFYLVP